MKTYYLLTTAVATALSFTAIAQRTTVKSKKATPVAMSVADHNFVQEAINSNNEAMTLAQMALQQSSEKDVQQISGQILNDHRAAQLKLYNIAQLKDSVPYNRYTRASSGTQLPLTDNLNNRRNRTIASISSSDTSRGSLAGSSTAANANTVISNNNTTQGSNPYTGTSYSVVNQTYNGNTAIDNAIGVNNPNRTDIAGYGGRWTENTTVVNNQPVTVAAQPAVNPITTPSNLPNGSVTTVSTPNTVDNTPNFPNRVIDTVRQTGAVDGFQNPGTNLSFPNNDRYAKTTPNTRPNNNAGSDYGYTGIAVNNAPTNALNTAAYSNNEINGNIVQTGQLQGTSNPTAVINSSTTSMNNNQVAYNAANANRANDAITNTQQNGVIVNNNRTNTPRTNMAAGTPVTDTAKTTTPILVGRAGNRTAAISPNSNNAATASSNGFYTNAIANTSATTALQNTTPDNFNKAWALQMSANQQVAIQKYQAALKRTRQPQVRAYINSVLPILQGHQYALQQWQAKL